MEDQYNAIKQVRDTLLYKLRIGTKMFLLRSIDLSWLTSYFWCHSPSVIFFAPLETFLRILQEVLLLDICLILLGVQYYTGQFFDIEKITAVAQKKVVFMSL